MCARVFEIVIVFGCGRCVHGSVSGVFVVVSCVVFLWVCV